MRQQLQAFIGEQAVGCLACAVLRGEVDLSSWDDLPPGAKFLFCAYHHEEAKAGRAMVFLRGTA